MNKEEYLKKHLRELIKKHNSLDTEIERAYRNYADDMFVHRLKSRKLKIKDEMSEIKLVLNG